MASPSLSPQPSAQIAAQHRAEKFTVVRTWPALSAPAKLAWLQLFELCAAGARQASVTPAEIGAYQGTSSDAGTRCLDALHLAGLIDARNEDGPVGRKTGRRLVTLLDPTEAAAGRRVACDPQSELPFEETDSAEIATCQDTRANTLSLSPPAPPATCATSAPAILRPTFPQLPTGADASADPPAQPRPRHLHLHREEDLSKTSTSSLALSGAPSVPSALEGGARVSDRGNALTTATDSGPSPLAACFPALAAPDPTARRQNAETIAAQIRAAVRCPKLQESVTFRAAWSVVDGHLSQKDLDQLLRGIDRAEIRVSRSAYFVGALKRLFHRHSIPWT